MCLKSNNEIIESATEPVECYKMLCVWNCRGNYWSPIYPKEWVIGERYKKEQLAEDFEVSDGYVRYYTGFHACLTYEGAVEYMKACIENTEDTEGIGIKNLSEIVIAKCHVPVGASYCIGKSEWKDIDGLVCWEIEINEIVGRFDKHGNVIEENSNSAI